MLCPALKSGRLRMPHAVLLHCCPQNRCSRRRSGGGAQAGRDVLLGGSGAGNRPCNSFHLETAHGLAGAYACVCALGLLIGCPLAITHLALERAGQAACCATSSAGKDQCDAWRHARIAGQQRVLQNSRSHLTNSMGAQL